MARRPVFGILSSVLLTAGCGSKKSPDPADAAAPTVADTAPAVAPDLVEAPRDTNASAPDAAAPGPADTPGPPSEAAPALPLPGADRPRLEAPLVLVPASPAPAPNAAVAPGEDQAREQLPTAVALAPQRRRVALAVSSSARPGHSTVRVIELGALPPPAEASASLTVPEDLLPAGQGVDFAQLRFDDSGETIAALGPVVGKKGAKGRWHAHVWRLDTLSDPAPPPAPAARWVSVFARTFDSSSTPLLVLSDNGERLALGGYGATAWDLPALPLEKPVPAAPTPILSMPAGSGWWLPTSTLDEQDSAFRIIELGGEPKRYGVLGAPFSLEAARVAPDPEQARPLPAFSNPSVKAMAALMTAEPLDGNLPPIALMLLDAAAEPWEVTLPAGAEVLAVGSDNTALVLDALPRGLYVLAPYQPEVRLPDAYAEAVRGALADDAAVLVLPDGSVQLVPIPDKVEQPAFTATTDVSALPTAFRPLFSKEGFALKGRSNQTSYEDSESGKTTRTPVSGRCAADAIEVADGLYHAVVSCVGLDVDYAVDFSGHWYATPERLWFRTAATEDRVALLRSATTLLDDGGCLTESSGEAHPEVTERCLDASGPSKASFEGGPSAYQIDFEVRRSR